MEPIVKIFLIGLLLTSNLAFAQTPARNSANDLCKNPSDCPVKSIDDIYIILGKIVEYAYNIFFAVAILFIIFAAFTFLTAKGDPQKIISARNQILWAAVAIAIALLSVGAETIIKDLLGSGTNTNISPSGLPYY